MSSRPPDTSPQLSDDEGFLADLVRDKRVVVCCGAGGVGKTTTAAALGLAGAAMGRKTLVLTIDPARRLAEAMGLSDAARVPTPVPRDRLEAVGVPAAGSLSAWMLAPDVVFESMVRRLTKDEARVNEILGNRLYQHLSKVVAGMQEYTAAEALYTLSEEGHYDLVILDTPPSRNALEFLEAPRKLSLFLDERVIGVFLPKGGAFWRTASELIESVFTRAFGQGFYGELQTFLRAFSGMFGGMRAHADAVRALLTSDESAFLLVTSPEPAALAEAAYFRGRMADMTLPFGGYVLNRSWAYTRGFSSPEDVVLAPDAPLEVVGALLKLRQLADAERWRARRDRDLLARLRMEGGTGAALATPHLGGAVEDLAGLSELARNLVRFDGA